MLLDVKVQLSKISLKLWKPDRQASIASINQQPSIAQNNTNMKNTGYMKNELTRKTTWTEFPSANQCRNVTKIDSILKRILIGVEKWIT